MAETLLKNGERLDDTGFGSIRVIQNPGFGYGVDSILVSAFAAGETGAPGIREGARVADLGTGCGVIALVTAHKVPGITVTGIEKSPGAADRAARSGIISGMDDRVKIVCCDVNDVQGRHDYDAVISNPPYFRRDPGRPNERDDERFVSRHETTAGIEDFVRAAASMLVRGGSLYLVHRPDRLADIFAAMRQAHIEPKTMQMAVPSRGQAANIVLIHGIMGGGPELRLLPDIVIHTDGAGYTEELLRLYER